MLHEAKTPSPAIFLAPAASLRRKRLILLCSEDLRPIACSLEDALQSRGWDVELEFGADARPWVQKVPPVQPSLRVLCVPGPVDRAVARQMRAAFQPSPEADLHIVGVDDSTGLVQEIERLAGVVPPRRRSLHARPRLAHPTQAETQVHRERRWRVGAASAAVAFAITFGGMHMVESSSVATPVTAAPITTPVTGPITAPSRDDAEPSRFDDPVLAAATPFAPPAPFAWDDERSPPPEEEDEVLLLDDEPTPAPRTTVLRVDARAPSLAEPRLAITPPSPAPITEALTITITSPGPALPSGFLPVAGLPVTDAATAAPTRRLPAGFLPVAGLAVTPRITTVDPFAFADSAVLAPSPLASEPAPSVDPFDADRR